MLTTLQYDMQIEQAKAPKIRNNLKIHHNNATRQICITNSVNLTFHKLALALGLGAGLRIDKKTSSTKLLA